MTINTANQPLLSLLIQHWLNTYRPFFFSLGLITEYMCLCEKCKCVSKYYMSRHFLIPINIREIPALALKGLLNLIQANPRLLMSTMAHYNTAKFEMIRYFK